MALIYATHRLHPAAAALLEPVAEVRVASALDGETLCREGRDAEAVIVRAPLPPALFDDAPRLRLAARHGAGLDMIPLEAATRAGVLVSNVPGVNARSVAEHVIMVTLALLRRLRSIDRLVRDGAWAAARQRAESGGELAGRRMGIVGFGNIGRAVAAIAHGGFGLEISAFTRRMGTLPPDVMPLPLDGLMASSDIIVLCCPLTPETTGLIDRRRIRLMKPSALLVNVARGAVIEDAALVTALRDHRIGGAALDVFKDQPLPLDHPYFGFESVVLTPHVAALTEEGMAAMGVGAAREVLRVLAGDLPVNLCNPDAVDAYRRRFG